MSKQRYLTGITTSGTPHLGNYVGAIRPAVNASLDPANESFYFLADYHALIKTSDPGLVRQSRLEIAATWLAAGLDPDNVTFYRQSDIPEIPELTWMLTCMTAKGLMNRAHAYKALVQDNIDAGAAGPDTVDPDRGISMGLFSYPILMAADILMFGAHKVPVGRDQIQHLEMTRDIAQRFNHHYGDILIIPEVVIEERTSVLAGLDGRKMSKSYNNTIPIFETEKKLRKSIMKIKTNSLEPGEPKETENNALFEIYRAFASPSQLSAMRQHYVDGIAWGEAKQLVFECINSALAGPREIYLELIQTPDKIDEILNVGAQKARVHSVALMQQLRKATGISR